VKRRTTIRIAGRRRNAAESGVALLISLFALLLISVVGMALIMATGTDSALTGNYRAAGSVYYAAMAGLAEGRARLLSQAPDNLGLAAGLPAGSVPQPGQVWYIINQMPGDAAVTPWIFGSTYQDSEYATEFGVAPPSPPTMQINSDSVANTGGGPAYTMYKWVRINPLTVAAALANGVNVNQGLGLPTAPVTYVNNHLSADQPGPYAMEITALAQTSTGSQRMLQYVTAPIQYNMSFNSALTLDGNGVSFTGSNALIFNGTDACNAGAPAIPGIGYTNAADAGNITGAGGANLPPSVVVPPTWQSLSGLNSLVQLLQQYNDSSYTPPAGTPATQANLPTTMAPNNPMTVVINGDLTLLGWHNTGYGILLVTGTFTYDPDASWNGVVLVVGQGHMVSTLHGAGVFNGAVLVAKTLADDGTPLASLGAATWQQDFGSGVNYNSCWINSVQGPVTYKVLSFREIPVATP
jgi:hypothetical protein